MEMLSGTEFMVKDKPNELSAKWAKFRSEKPDVPYATFLQF